jgi:hypothetical protein
MKKIVLLIAFLIGVESINALPVGNPSDASLFYEIPCDSCSELPCNQTLFPWEYIRLGVGYYGDFVFNRHLETVTGRQIDYTQIATNAGYLSLSFWEAFDIFATIGTTKFKFNTSLGPFNASNTSPRFDFESSTSISWSIGAHGTLLEYCGAVLGVEAQYFTCHPSAKVLFIRANVDDYPDENSRYRYTELQIGGGISYRYNPYFIPYVAVKCSRALWEFNDQSFLVTDTLATIPNLKNAKHWGYAVGLTLSPFQCEQLAVTIEGRFSDEKAVYINGQILF